MIEVVNLLDFYNFSLQDKNFFFINQDKSYANYSSLQIEYFQFILFHREM